MAGLDSTVEGKRYFDKRNVCTDSAAHATSLYWYGDRSILDKNLASIEYEQKELKIDILLRKKILFWSDEFNGPNLDDVTWRYDVGNGVDGGHRTLEYYQSSSISQGGNNGHLVITADKTPGGRITSGRVITRDKVALQYGRIEARIRVPQTKGTCPSFRLLGSHQ